jgi:hypothetical protein
MKLMTNEKRLQMGEFHLKISWQEIFPVLSLLDVYKVNK